MHNILVTGGAGYIGSHTVSALLKNPHYRVIVLDDLRTGFVDNIPRENFVHGSIHDIELVSTLLHKENITSVLHFAASTVITASIQSPLDYYHNNVTGTLNLLQACQRHPIDHFIFSSSAAVYGEPVERYLNEDHPTQPDNPYAQSKLMGEQILKDAAKALGFRYAILRYFNVAGASLDGHLGQRTAQATHLIKNAVQTACGKQPYLFVFGNDYPTPDGTCVRDYIHVADLADAHVCALSYLKAQGESITLNCGYGKGFSVHEVIQTLEMITERPLPVRYAPRRAGDLMSVVADNTRIKKILHWKPHYNDLSFIIKTALQFEQRALT